MSPTTALLAGIRRASAKPDRNAPITDKVI
jgi:hypothetical protein